MDTTTIVSFAVGAVAIVLALYATFRPGASGAGITGHIEDYQNAIQQAKGLVTDAETLYNTGKLERNDRFAWVLERLQKTYPSINADLLATTVESAVSWLRVKQVVTPSAAPQRTVPPAPTYDPKVH